MEKQLKDYLHLYLGCEIMNEGIGKKYILKGYKKDSYKDSVIISSWENDDEDGYWSTISNYIDKDFKPILRPLSDMTEEEAIEMGLYIPIQDHRTFKEVQKQVKSSTECGFGPAFKSEQFIQLLSKHFDLFGLIEASLAIDKTTL